MVFKIGGTTVIDNSGNHITASSNSGSAGASGYYDGGGNRLDNLNRYFSYTDDYAGNCRGYLPNGNCFGNPNWSPPNGNWWTWGVLNIPTTNCRNDAGAAGNANCSTAFNAVSVNYVYDAYYELYSRIGSGDKHRNYSHCNCNSGTSTIGNCYTNCNCNCNCNC